MSQVQPNYLRQLRRLIDKHFNLGELEQLIFDLGLDCEHLPGDTRPRKITALLLYLTRQSQLDKITYLLREERGQVAWPDVPPDEVLREDFINLAIKGEYRNLLDPETRYLTELIYKLRGYDGPLEYVDLRGEAYLRGTASGAVVRIERKLLDPAFSVIEIPSSGKGAVGLDEPKKIPVEKVQEAVKKYPRFVLIGEPGAGKTTTLRRLALDSAWQRMSNPDAPIPLWKELPRWRDEQELEEFISEGWKLDLDLPVALVKGDVILYLDSLNEMGASSKDKAAILKRWFKGQNHPQQAIVSCRAENYRELDLDITTVLVEELDEEKIRAFAENYLGKKTRGFLERILPKYGSERGAERHLYHLARNPFMLRALTIIYAALPGSDLPANTGVVFQELIKTLWNREKARKTPGWVGYNEMLNAFSVLAFSMMEDGRSTIIPLEHVQKYVPLTILQVAHSANIVRIDGDLLSFYHQTMQEYLAAVYVLLAPGTSGFAKLLKHATDDQWHELFLMTISLLYNADAFFDLFFKKLDELVREDRKVVALLEWADTKANNSQQMAHKLSAVRSYYISFAFALTNYLDRGRALIALTQAFDLDLTQALDPEIARTLDHDHILMRELGHDRTRILALALTRVLDLNLAFDLNLALDRALTRAFDHACYLAHVRVNDQDHTLTRAFALDLDNTRDLARQLSKALKRPKLQTALSLLQIPDSYSSRQKREAFSKELETIMIEHRQFRIWKFSEIELQNLDNYLRVSILLVDCLKQATVSDRQEIENRLLLPPKSKK
jgi:hypothetical protein